MFSTLQSILRPTPKRILCLLFLFLLPGGAISLIGHRELVVYLWEQGSGQWHLIRHAQPLDSVRRGNVPPRLRERLRWVEQIKVFAARRLHFSTANTYESLYSEEPPRIMWVVSACRPYSFTEKTWDFPLLGSFPYKGFFNKESALRTCEKLKKEGYDTYLSSASGWSTLGWLPNPLTLSMLERPKSQLANLIIHELTHNNIYVKNNAPLNENIASFAGHHGALLFLRETHGASSREVQDYLIHRRDHEQYFLHLLGGMERLEHLYQGMPGNASRRMREEMKYALITCIVEELQGLDFHDARWTQKHRDSLPNNAFFLSYRNYYSDQKKMEAAFAASGKTLGAYLQCLKASHE